MDRLREICTALLHASNALSILLIDEDGIELARAGDAEGFSGSSLSSLFGGNVAATGGIAQLLSEKEFSGRFHEGVHTNVHLSFVAQRVILAVLFDHRSSLGLVRLRVKKASEELTRALQRGPAGSGGPPPAAAAPAQIHTNQPFKRD